MNLATLLPLIDDIPGYRQLLEALREGGRQRLVVLDAATPYLLAGLHRELGHPMLVLVAQPEEAKQLQDQLLSWRGEAPVHVFPEPDALPYERLAPDPATVQQRIKALSMLQGIESPDRAPLVIASAFEVEWWVLGVVSFLNTVAASGDIIGIILLAAQVPRDAIVQNRGWRSYWRPAEVGPPG